MLLPRIRQLNIQPDRVFSLRRIFEENWHGPSFRLSKLLKETGLIFHVPGTIPARIPHVRSSMPTEQISVYAWRYFTKKATSFEVVGYDGIGEVKR